MMMMMMIFTCVSAAMESTGVERGLNAAGNSQADVTALHSGNEVENLSTNSVSRHESTAGSGEATADKPNVLTLHKRSGCDEIEKFDDKQTLDSDSNAASAKTRLAPQNRAIETVNSGVEMRTGHRIRENNEEFDQELSRTIQIADVGEDLLDMIELYVEHRKHGGGEVEKFDYDRKLETLMVVFVDARGLTTSLSVLIL